MLSKKSMKVVSVILLVMMMLVTLSNMCFAYNVPSPNQNAGGGKLTGPVEMIMGIVQWGGIVAAVIMAMVIGIKYVTASPDGKAEVKKTLTIYVTGIVLMLSASTIVTFIKDQIVGTLT